MYMNLFDGVIFEKQNITVLGVEKNSAFLADLSEYINKNGNSKNINAPDIMDGNCFYVHSKEEADSYKSNSFVIGIVNVDVFEKRICDVVKNYERLCEIANIASDELAYPFVIAKTIIQRENYDLLYIDGVNSVSKRFLARELAKNIRNGMGIRIINTDNCDVEILCS